MCMSWIYVILQYSIFNIQYTHPEYSTYIVFKAAFEVYLHCILINQHAFSTTTTKKPIQLVGPIRKEQEWAAPLTEGSWELRVAPGWQASVLPHCHMHGPAVLKPGEQRRSSEGNQGQLRAQTLPDKSGVASHVWGEGSKRSQQGQVGAKRAGTGHSCTYVAARVRSWGRSWAGTGFWAKGLRCLGEPQIRLLTAHLCRALCTALCRLLCCPSSPAEPSGSRETTCRASWCTHICNILGGLLWDYFWIYPTCALLY